MSKIAENNLRKVVAEVSEDVLISLKILSLKKKIPLGVYVTEILDAHVRNKSKAIEVAEILQEKSN